jgi:RsiW-degrading membrane proteinase PrsW (M82 family)
MANNDPDRKNWTAILSLSLSALGILFFLIQTLSLAVLWFINFSNPQGSLDQTISFGLMVWSSILSALMLIPVFLLNLYRMRDREPPDWLDTSRPIYRKVTAGLIFSWPILVLVGWLISANPPVAALLLGPVNILVAGLPILWIYRSASRGLNRGMQVRQWQVFGFSLTITPVIVIIAEIIAIALLGGVGVLWQSYRMSNDPQYQQNLMNLVNQIRVNQGDVETLLRIIEPYLRQPSVIAWTLVVFAGLVPIIEEVIKPLALWAYAGRRMSPQEGFVGGLLCGAGFALMENVLYFTLSITAMDWLVMAVGRAGTGVLHMLGSGLVGWGLVKAWRDGRWVFLGVTSIIAFVLHGLWNALSLVGALTSLTLDDPNAAQGKVLLNNLPSFVLFLISILGIVLINRHFNKENHKKDTDIEALDQVEDAQFE